LPRIKVADISSHLPTTQSLSSQHRPVRGGRFYGWLMAPIATAMAMCTMPGQSVGVAAFNQSLRTDLGLSASQLGGCYALGTVLASLLLPFTGAAIDRFGIRRTTLFVVPAFAAACCFVSAAAGLVSLFFAFFFLRFLGQGSLSLCSQNTLAMWFDRRLGRVAGITSTLVTLFMAASPLWLRAVIESVGWRAAYQWLGLGVVLVLMPMLVIYRNRPADVGQSPDGLIPDGLARAPSEGQDDSIAEMEGLSMSAALRESSYWILIALNFVWSMIGTSLIFDVQSLGESFVGDDVAATAWGSIPVDAANTCFFVSVGVMNLVGGFLADKYALTKLLSSAMVGMFGGVLMLIVGQGVLVLFLAYGVYGLAQGLMSAVSNTIWPRFFGRAHLGKIRGGSMMAMVAGSSVGPLLMGVVFDQTGSHRASLMIFALCITVAFVASMFIRQPNGCL
jgi:MFS family permease